MGQQIDGWFCGRWALANLAVLYENTCKALQERQQLASTTAANHGSSVLATRREYATCSSKQLVDQFIMRLLHVGYCFSSHLFK
jgi:hypothetical protein